MENQPQETFHQALFNALRWSLVVALVAIVFSFLTHYGLNIYQLSAVAIFKYSFKCGMLNYCLSFLFYMISWKIENSNAREHERESDNQ